jgi:hypothetical protein
MRQRPAKGMLDADTARADGGEDVVEGFSGRRHEP